MQESASQAPILKIYDDGFLRVEHDGFYVECGGINVDLRKTEFQIISLLTQNAGRFVSYEVIWEYLWHGQRPLNIGSLNVFVYRLRRKFEPRGVRIDTMVSVGYRIVPRTLNNFDPAK